ncbi:MAG TPA: hypothetical protein VF614_08600, partial [Chthoniobacteraceae bacterium]
MRRALNALIFFAALIALWHFAVKANPRTAMVLPAPLDIWYYLVAAVEDRTLFEALWVTTKRLMLGYVIGVAIGIPTGLLTARFRWASDTIGVLGLGLQTLPSVCWVPL